MSILKLLAADGFYSVNAKLTEKLGVEPAFMLGFLASRYNLAQKNPETMLTRCGEFFFYSIDDVEKLTRWKKDKQNTALKPLIDGELIIRARKGNPGARAFRFTDQLATALDNLLADKPTTEKGASRRKNRQQASGKPDNSYNIYNKGLDKGKNNKKETQVKEKKEAVEVQDKKGVAFNFIKYLKKISVSSTVGSVSGAILLACKGQPSRAELERLVSIYPTEYIKTQLVEMLKYYTKNAQRRAKLKKIRSFYLTLNNWLKKEYIGDESPLALLRDTFLAEYNKANSIPYEFNPFDTSYDMRGLEGIKEKLEANFEAIKADVGSLAESVPALFCHILGKMFDFWRSQSISTINKRLSKIVSEIKSAQAPSGGKGNSSKGYASTNANRAASWIYGDED